MTQHNLILISIPAVVALCGGFLAAFWKPSQQNRSLIQHFAAGVVLAALAVELLPEIAREHAPGPVLIGAFALGSLFMYGLKLWTERLLYLVTEELLMEAHTVKEKPISTLILFAGFLTFWSIELMGK